MRRRNRRKRINGFITTMPYVGVVVLIASIALMYLWLNSRCETLGREIKQLEKAKEEFNKKYLTEEYRWAQMKSPKNIEKQLAKFKINMFWPSQKQVIRIADKSAMNDKPTSTAARGYASRQRNFMNE